jgi:hypothetical protein
MKSEKKHQSLDKKQYQGASSPLSDRAGGQILAGRILFLITDSDSFNWRRMVMHSLRALSVYPYPSRQVAFDALHQTEDRKRYLKGHIEIDEKWTRQGRK